MCSTWLLAVLGAIESSVAISAFVRPSVISRATVAAHRAPGGDANVDVDSLPVRASMVRGRVAWSIPGLGSVVTTVRGGPAVVLLVGVPLTLLVATEAFDLRGTRGTPSAA